MSKKTSRRLLEDDHVATQQNRGAPKTTSETDAVAIAASSDGGDVGVTTVAEDRLRRRSRRRGQRF